LSGAAPAAEPPAVVLKGLTRRFPGVLAADAVSLEIRAGEVHALLGENGAGKSTLIGLLSGLLQPDAGEIRVDGRPVTIASPRAARRLGIGTVHQKLLLVPSLTALENLLLGAPWWRPVDRRGALRRFEALRGLLAAAVPPDVPVGRLALGQQQQVEIMRALWHGERILLLDEPTAMLTPEGVRELAAVIGRLRAQGLAVVLITHKLGEAFDLADRVSVLRRGRVVGALSPAEVATLDRRAATARVIGWMFGRTEAQGGEVPLRPRPPVDRSGPPLLDLRMASVRGEAGEPALRDLSLRLWPGEVVGVAGVDGNGQTQLAEALAGQRPLSGGALILDGRDVSALGVAGRRAAGVRYLTDDRLGEGSVATLPLSLNLLLERIGQPPFWRRGLPQDRPIAENARHLIAAHDVRAPSEATPAGSLSGGNLQKLLLAREADPAARLLILNKPTTGLDLQATRRTRALIRAGGGTAGAALLVVSNELDELLETCDRIAVMEGGRICGIVDAGPGAEAAVGRLMLADRAA